MGRLNLDQLRRMAEEMKKQINGGNGSAERVVYPYYVALFRRHEFVRLHVGRTDTWPTIEECRPVAEVFGVPDETDATGETLRMLSQDGHSVRVKTLRYAWVEA